MQLHSILLLVLLFTAASAFAQEEEEIGTLKIARPQNPVRLVQPDTSKPSRMFILETGVAARLNQSFFKYGWGGEAGVLFKIATMPAPDLEIQYCRVNGHFDLSGYNFISQQVIDVVKNTQTRMDMLKMPLVLTFGHWTGPDYFPYIETGLAPSMLLSVKNEYGRINMSDMHRFNCAYVLGGGVHMFHRLRVGLRFSGDLLSNLKDDNVYNYAGTKVGRQNSRNYILSFSAAYMLKRYYLFGNRQ